ncbi:MAG: PIN domain-containing protein [Rubrobacteraceae bacterium]|uniref:PIN domain-containing protein n=1 Tax=Rubrobacter naiadicus TaxID=1392641 RepID=UPI00235E86B8|nr:PIN domain-containing protein [Rubrobacter naiadicus]MBX6763702.1 PIN domain-containing protein [Rubrobacteraceae bacterium]
MLYPAYLRDLLLRLAQAGVYQPRWSAKILDEVACNVKKGRDAAERQKVDRMISLMQQHFEDAEVTGYEGLLPAMTNDPKDRHVLAAAITGGADVIVTYNLRHFPPHSREPYNIDAQGPDGFLLHQWEQVDPERFVAILERWTAQLQRHPDTLEGVLEERLITTAPEFSRAVLEYVRREKSR